MREVRCISRGTAAWAGKVGEFIEFVGRRWRDLLKLLVVHGDIQTRLPEPYNSRSVCAIKHYLRK